MATRVIAEGLRPEETSVSKVMTKNPVFVMGDTLAVEALQKMVQGAGLSLISNTRYLLIWQGLSRETCCFSHDLNYTIMVCGRQVQTFARSGKRRGGCTPGYH